MGKPKDPVEVLYLNCAIIRSRETNINAANWTKKLIIIQIFIHSLRKQVCCLTHMHKPTSNSSSQLNPTSSLLLSHIKDEQFYSTLSTITLQLAKETGASQNVIEELSRCFSHSRSGPYQPLLTKQKQNNHSHQNINLYNTGTYDRFQKSISLKEQLNFLTKIQKDLVQSREKQLCVHALQKYAKEKQAELMPLFNTVPETKASRFKKMLNRKQQNKVCTSTDYFKLNTLDLLKNAYQNSNECYTMMKNFTLLKTMFGHSMDEDPESNCPLYNVLFDQSENLIISGGEQGAIKIWSKQTGLLLSSLKGHQEYINKLEVTKCNKYICSSAGDGVRFFELKDMTTLTGWKAESIIEITSVYDETKKLSKFIFGDKKNLYVLDELKMLAAKSRSMTKDDFSVYKYSHKLHRESFILNIQVSSDQKYVLLGFEYGDIFLFHYKELFTIDPIKSDTEPLSNLFNLPIRHHLKFHCDEIRQLKWHQNNQYFVSGGKEGYCLLWEYKNEKIPTIVKDIQVSKLFNRRKKRAFGCNFILFNCTYTHFIAGFMELVDEDDDDRGNGDVIAYSLESKEVIFEFSKDMPIKVASVRGMDAHPTFPNIVVVCEGTGRILIIDFLLKTILNTFELRGFHLLHPHFALNPGDCRFSKDGRYFVVSTEFGSVSIFGYDLKTFYQTCPSQQFYETDFTAFTVNEKMQPIPIEGDLQIDMNRIERGEIRRIRGTPYEKQFTHNFHKYWEELERQKQLKPIEHKNSLMKKDDFDEDNQTYREYLEKIKHNSIEAETFNKLYHKNLEEIQATKQSLLYDEREKQFKVFKKIIEEKVKKLKGDSSLLANQASILPSIEMTHDQILEQIDAKGKRGGRRLTRHNQPVSSLYKDQFDYDNIGDQEFNINEEPEEEQLNELDYSVDNSSSQIQMRTTRRQFNGGRRQRVESRPRYNIRSRQNGRTHYREQDSEEEKKQRNFKRPTPAEDVQEMLKDETFRDYDMSQGRKKRKRNRMRESDEDFIEDKSEESEFLESPHSQNARRRQRTTGIDGGRTRSRRMVIPELEQGNSEEAQQNYGRLKKRTQRRDQSELEQKPSSQQVHHNLRTRNQNTTNSKQSSTKKPKRKDLGECYRCAVNEASVICHYEDCGTSCCQNCKFKRGKQLSDGKYECFVCSYINSVGTAIVDEKKLTEQYFRLNDREHNIYVPQVDDLVRFFFQGYEEFLSQNIRYLNIEAIDSVEGYLLMPHIYPDFYGEALLQTPLCKVKDIRYFFPFNPSGDYLSTTYKRRTNTNEKKHINMLVNLEIADDSKKKDLEKTDFWVFFIPGPLSPESDNQYLLREQVYHYIEDNKVLQGLKQHQTVQIYGQEYQIVEVSPSEDCFPQSIWRQIKASRSDGKRLRNASKQAERRFNLWQISQLVPPVEYKQGYKAQQYQKKIIDRIGYIRDNIEGRQLYEDYVDLEFIPTYRKMIECGICIMSIEQRIQNNYYRSLASLQFDLDLMVKNAILFNGEENEITKTGILIRKEILKAINAPDEQIKKFSLGKEQVKENKREKRVVKKKELDNDFVVDEEVVPPSIYGLRNQKPTRGKAPEPQIQKVQKGEKRPVLTTKKYKIVQESQSQYNQAAQKSSSQQQLPQKRPSLRPNRFTPPPQPKPEPSSTRSRRYDKIIQDYDKEEEVYRNIQNNRRNRSAYVDSSYDSNEKPPAQAAYSTRRSSRLHS